MKLGKVAKHLIALTLPLFIMACGEEVQFSTVQEAAKFLEEDPNSPNGKVAFSLEQRGDGGAVDILVVIDNSLSMLSEQKKVGARFGDFTSELGDVDWQMAFINTDATTNTTEDGWHGKFYNLGNSSQKILRKGSAGAQDLFLDTINRIDDVKNCYIGGSSGPCPTDNEEALKAIMKSIDLKDTDNRGFFRRNAGLAVMILSDEDEMSDGPIEATKPDALLNHIKQKLGPDKSFSAYGMIIKPGDSACKDSNGGDGDYGTHVDELARKTNGLTQSICASNYSSSLKAISKGMRRNLLIKDIDLDHKPIKDSLRVLMIPDAGITWKLKGQKIEFSSTPPEGSQIHVFYEYKKKTEDRDEDSDQD